MQVQIIQDFIPRGRKNRPAGKNPMRYITIHNTGNANRGAGAKSHANYLKGDSAANAPVSWHYTVDDVVIVQHLPDEETAYHAGDGSGTGNTQSIGIEICENNDCDLFTATENAVALSAQLCKKHNIPVENIVQHFKWSGKDCPHLLRRNKPYSWADFLDKVKRALQGKGPEETKPGISPEEVTVDNALAVGIISDRAYWLNVLKGTTAVNPAYMKIVLDKSIPARTPEEITVDNALAAGLISDRAYWLGVLRGTTAPNPAFIKIVMDNAHKKLSS
ncbi:MAG: N-acetylmuramoyl-L-alanine amidase [Defluviitaleaceae bacterium]|nr:N-acetylmuramoyl-L-alanine amidase [Defluviitaleaceae bacterium]